MNISREEFQEWKHHPVSKIVLQYIRDFKERAKLESLESWLNGDKSFADLSDGVRAQINILDEVENLQFEAIEEFYQEKEQDIAAESPVNQKS